MVVDGRLQPAVFARLVKMTREVFPWNGLNDWR